MDKLKEVTKDPAKLEEALKTAWSKIDTKIKDGLPLMNLIKLLKPL